MPKWIIILLIIVVAAVFRLSGLSSIPPGLYPDEAMNGNNAIRALEFNDYKVFYLENNGREGLFINLQALSLKVFGYYIWALRIVPAIAGILTVLGLYLLAKQLFNWQIAAYWRRCFWCGDFIFSGADCLHPNFGILLSAEFSGDWGFILISHFARCHWL